MSRSGAIAALGLLGLAGCASVEKQDYPAQWPALAPAAAGCPPLGGTYMNRGEGTVSRTLASWLIEGSTTAQAIVDRVGLDGPAHGQMTVTLLDRQGRVLAVRRWAEGAQYHCADGMLLVARPQGLAMVGVAMSMQARLAPAVDGSLVVETRESGGGVVIVVPYVGAYRYWSRFPALAAPSP